MAAVATAAAPQVAVDRQLRRWRAVVWVAAGVFVVVFGLLILHRHRTFGTFNFDLGIFDQGLWLLSRAETPFITLRGLHLFGDHSSYLMLPVVPLYWVLPDVRAMLILTVAVLALGAPVVWAAARGEGLSPTVSAALAVGYLFHPATQWSTWDNFHPETLTIPLLIGAFALGQRNRFVAMVALLVLVLAAKEDAALVVVPFAIYVWWRWRRPVVAVAVAALAVGAFLLNTLVLLPMFSPTGELIYTGRYAQFGEGLGGALVGMVTNPGKVVAELATIDRLGYLAGMLLPLATCLFAPELLAVGLPITLANLLSIHVYQHELKWHYTSYLIAVVAMAAVVGARRHGHPPARHPHRRALAVHSLLRRRRECRRRPVAGRRGDPMGGMGSRPRAGRCCTRHHPRRRRRGGRLGHRAAPVASKHRLRVPGSFPPRLL